jgi:putative nucleotidyltransferase with HDIG domain
MSVPPSGARRGVTAVQVRSGAFSVFYFTVLAGAIALLVILSPHAHFASPAVLAFWALLMLVAEASPIRLPGGGFMTVSSAIDYAGIIVFGPVVTAWIDIVSTLFAEMFITRRPFRKALFNLALFPVTTILAGSVYIALGGKPGSLTLPQDVVPIFGCGLVYFVFNTASISTVIALSQKTSAWRVWQVNFLWTVFHLLAFLPLGSIIALLYFHTKLWGVLLFFLPLMLARYSFKLYTDMRQDLVDFVRALTTVIDEIDPYTRHHSLRVAQYSVKIAREMGLPERDVETIECAALMHDLGKISSRHRKILAKPAQLSSEERRLMAAHPAAGADIVEKVRSLRRASHIVRAHHERPDGKGYPFGLRAKDVPVGARILNVADSFDAMTSDRPYKASRSVEEALAELERCAGTQFDAEVVAAMKRLHGKSELEVYGNKEFSDLVIMARER